MPAEATTKPAGATAEQPTEQVLEVHPGELRVGEAVAEAPTAAGVDVDPPSTTAEGTGAGHRAVVVLGHLPPVFAEPVVAGPFLLIREDVVGLADLLETFLRAGILV